MRERSIKDVFANFYGLGNFPSYEEYCVEQESTAADAELSDRQFFNSNVYLRRIEVSIEIFLLEADARGKAAETVVYAQMTGLGLGAWLWQPEPELQKKLFLIAFQRVLERNGRNLNFVAVVDLR
jgi:Domain of unknown function (DUF4804)